jgi:hypothetical protein
VSLLTFKDKVNPKFRQTPVSFLAAHFARGETTSEERVKSLLTNDESAPLGLLAYQHAAPVGIQAIPIFL